MLNDYDPDPVDVEDIIEFEIALSISDSVKFNGDQVATLTNELVQSVEKTLQSGQVLYFPEGLCDDRKFNVGALGRFVRDKIEEKLEGNKLKHAEVLGEEYLARVEAIYDRFNSIRIFINDERYQSGRTVFIDDLGVVRRHIGRDPKAGDIIKVKNIRFKRSIKTPNGGKGKMSLQNQRVADFVSLES